jgi:hypothetical protein
VPIKAIARRLNSGTSKSTNMQVHTPMRAGAPASPAQDHLET